MRSRTCTTTLLHLLIPYDKTAWSHNGRQVADFRHSPTAALEEEIVSALQASGETDDLESQAAEICESAIDV